MNDKKLNVSATTEGAYRALIRVYGLLKRIMEPYFARFGISGAQWGVLRTLHRAETEGLTGIRLTDLGDRLIIRPPSVTTVVDRLQRMGLVTRKACSTDLRVKYVSMTAEGRQLVERVHEKHGGQIQAVMNGLNLQEQEEFHRLLDLMAAELETMAGQAEGSLVRR